MSLTDKAHQIISEKILTINFGVDATCGNGHDTIFLAGLCSGSGKVLSFDIQEKALNCAHSNIVKSGFEHMVEFINDGHENIEKYISEDVDVVMFNLGYLPNSDQNITTKGDTTIAALSSAVKVLSVNALITIICYPGHKDGIEETEHVRNWLAGLDKKKFSISEYLSEKPDDSTPVLYILEKMS